MYIPRGKVTTQQAVQRLFELRHPDEAARLPRLEAESRLLTVVTGRVYSNSPCPAEETRKANARLPELHEAIGAIRRLAITEGERLRDALAEGDLSAVALTTDGGQFDVPIEYWRSHEGLRGLMNGHGDHRLSAWIKAQASFLLSEKDFLRWADGKHLVTGPDADNLRVSDPGGRIAEQSEKGRPINKPGPKPKVTDSTTARMVRDYAGRAEALAEEKFITLQNKYKVSKDTVGKARKKALPELRKISGTTPDTGK